LLRSAPSHRCNESVKNHLEDALRGVYPTEEAAAAEPGLVRGSKSANNALFFGDF
jgi:hypothetical protein